MKRLLATLLLSLAMVAAAAPLAQDPDPSCNPCSLPPAPSAPIR